MILKPIVEIIRLEENYDHGTFGVMKINKEVFCWTLEPRDEENAQNISSIPVQQYVCKRVKTGLSSVLRLGLDETFAICDVPGRTDVRFHPGNTDNHTLACILMGETLGKLRGDRAILNSGKTFLRFMNVLEGYDEFHLTIREEY